MASEGATVSTTSRLTMMQMRFQQKQLQEREQRRMEMVGVGSQAANDKSVGAGKVRQMFDERRRGAGIDRSNPLKPISGSSTKSTNQSKNVGSTPNGSANVTNSTITTTTLRNKPNQPKPKPPANVRQPINTIRNTPGARGTNGIQRSNGNNNTDETDFLDNTTFPKGFSSLSLKDNNNSDSNNNDSNTTSRLSSSNSIKLNPVVTKKSPVISVNKTTVRSTLSPNGVNRSIGSKPPTSNVNSTNKSPIKKTVAKVPTNSMSIKPPPRIVTPPPGMATCNFCNRNFNEDRLAKHEQICQKMAKKKRKIFDVSKHRVQGTEAEQFVKKATKTSHTTKPTTMAKPSVAASTSTNATTSKKNNWRQKHEEFIAAIRAAKQLQVHLAKGGKLSDLPPPPPSENPDYIQCPHCNRRFNEAAAERHIPKCANMLHNKPKPGAMKKR
ncbi:zinc finger C2HC domain-containing protein 1C isoform X1 [Teleopsis dalmanni]|uniref:zinc finger C2HC domain-containing protein 1C isoform X1 n=1 Tax=Teleopsis dalmanni TaxID=139649 RepID=UPI0018CEA1A5|nr:zinc finger C2HC domain-containing protein 1C isoform X1 [Teleopsis dalmanni]